MIKLLVIIMLLILAAELIGAVYALTQGYWEIVPLACLLFGWTQLAFERNKRKRVGS